MIGVIWHVGGPYRHQVMKWGTFEEEVLVLLLQNTSPFRHLLGSIVTK